MSKRNKPKRVAMFFVYLIITSVFLVFWWVKRRYNYWKDQGFLSPPSEFPFGSVKGIGTSLTSAETMDKIYKDFKGKAPVIGIYSFLEPSVLPIDPEICKNILVRDFSSFHDRGFYYNKKDDPLSAK